MGLDLSVKYLQVLKSWQEAAKTLKKLSFELGGKNPNIIFADVDIDEVVDNNI